MDQEELAYKLLLKADELCRGNDIHVNMYVISAQSEIELTQDQETQIESYFSRMGLVDYWPGSKDHFRISAKGITFLQKEKSKRGLMKQSEKLDLVLKWLYARRHERHNTLLKRIMEELNIYESREDEDRIATRLHSDGLARAERMAAGTLLTITSEGVEYCEESSYSKPGFSLTTFNIGTVHSSNFLNNTGSISGSTINQSLKQDNAVGEIISKIKQALPTEASLSSTEKEEILNRLDEIEEKLSAQKQVRKHNITDLLSVAANSAQVMGFVIQLGQVLHLLPVG